jgi:hypothetical protein
LIPTSGSLLFSNLPALPDKLSPHGAVTNSAPSHQSRSSPNSRGFLAVRAS